MLWKFQIDANKWLKCSWCIVNQQMVTMITMMLSPTLIQKKVSLFQTAMMLTKMTMMMMKWKTFCSNSRICRTLNQMNSEHRKQTVQCTIIPRCMMENGIGYGFIQCFTQRWIKHTAVPYYFEIIYFIKVWHRNVKIVKQYMIQLLSVIVAHRLKKAVLINLEVLFSYDTLAKVLFHQMVLYIATKINDC